MRFDRGLVGFGLFLVTIGTVMIAVRQGVLSEDVAGLAIGEVLVTGTVEPVALTLGADPAADGVPHALDVHDPGPRP